MHPPLFHPSQPQSYKLRVRLAHGNDVSAAIRPPYRLPVPSTLSLCIVSRTIMSVVFVPQNNSLRPMRPVLDHANGVYGFRSFVIITAPLRIRRDRLALMCGNAVFFFSVLRRRFVTPTLRKAHGQAAGDRFTHSSIIYKIAMSSHRNGKASSEAFRFGCLVGDAAGISCHLSSARAVDGLRRHLSLDRGDNGLDTLDRLC